MRAKPLHKERGEKTERLHKKTDEETGLALIDIQDG